MIGLLNDIRFTLRALGKRPMYAGLTVLILALAIGANATVFSMFNGLFLKPLPYPDDDRLVMVYNTYPRTGPEYAGTSIPDFLDRRQEAPSLEDLAIYSGLNFSLGVDGVPERVLAMRVSPSFFDVLGVGPQRGRTFSDDEATPGNDQVVILSHSFWRTHFGERPDVIGSDVHFNGNAYRVVGVMPADFVFPSANVQAWVPFAFTEQQMTDAGRGQEFSNSIGRLRAGATLEGLNAELDAIVTRNVERLGGDAAAFIETTGFTGRAGNLRDFLVGDLRATLLVLQALVFAVLLIACANIANLQLARVADRRRELSLRAALGAQARRLAGMVVLESLVLALAGAVAGLMLAFGGLELVRSLGLDRATQGFEFSLDVRVIGFTAAAAMVAAIVASLVPVATLLRTRLAQAINEAGRIGGGRATRAFRNGLVVAQIAMSAALLVGAGLLAKSFYHLQQEGPGFNADYVLTGSISMPQNRFPDAEAQGRFLESVFDELRSLPGVSRAGFSTHLPFGGGNSSGTFNVDGYTPPEGAPQPHAQVRSINEDLFPALDVPIIRGRNFQPQEADRVAIVDQNIAQRFWPEGDAVGQRVRMGWEAEQDIWYTIIGVVPAIKHGSLTDDANKETIYWHYSQRTTPSVQIALRTAVPPEQLTRLVADAIARVDSGTPVFGVQPMAVRVSDSLGPQRTSLVLTLVFATVAFILAIVGVYGVLNWMVTQRYRELGVRMSLGARGIDIMRLVVGQGARLTLIGMVAGVLTALALGRALSSQLHGVSALDPMVFTLVIGGLTAAAMLASWVPALRASRIDPMKAIRLE